LIKQKKIGVSGRIRIRGKNSIRIRDMGYFSQHLLKEHCNVVLQPFLMGCDTKCRDITLLCISAIQRLITHQVLNEPAASNIVSLLWQLMEAQLEEVRLLQVTIFSSTETFCHATLTQDITSPPV